MASFNLFLKMPGRSHRGPLPPMTEEERETARRLGTHIERLASEIGERNLYTPGSLERSADYIRGAFAGMGLESRSQILPGESPRLQNIEVEFLGNTETEEILVVGAHYDTVSGSPGANDNGTGVAAVLELGRLLSRKRFDRTVRLVAFVNEEPPFFLSGEMGSYVYAREAKAKKEKIVGMLSLETIGYYSDEEGSQSYPPPLSFIYPSKGNFIGFVGNTRSGRLVRSCIASFRRHTQFPSEGLTAPSAIPGVGWSDHWSFWEMGYPAVMVTDTAPYRYPFYHTSEDTPDKVDFEKVARVVVGLARVVGDLATAANGFRA